VTSGAADLGAQVRHLRTSLGLSVRELAERTEFSPSFISQLENGTVSPSLSSLERIGEALGVGLRDLFDGPAQRKSLVVKRDERPETTSSWSRARLEAVSVAGQRLSAVFIVLERNGRSGTRARAHAREEFAFVTQGELVLVLEDQQHTLRAEDAVVIPAGTRRLWTNESGAQACVLIVSVR
jgi:transcriptional regulator with XRE-family HTH domain